MALKVLIAPDKFKGTLSAAAVAEAIARGWRHVRPEDRLELLPMSDGGEGFGEMMGRLLGAEVQTVRTVDAAHRPVTVEWWWERRTATAIIESATTIGLALLPAGRFHPFELDTFGLGAVLQAAANAGAKRCLLGVGGSATNDGGFGLARSLGWRFFNRRGEEIQRWMELAALARVEPPEAPARFGEVVVAVDVQNSLLGPSGCTRIFGPQKGLRTGDFRLAEQRLARLAKIAEKQCGFKCANECGTGAAGGLGFGLRCFARAKLESGFEVFSHHADLAVRVKVAQVVLTGEGRVDEQTFMGKGAGRLAEMCRDFAVPCIVFAGEISAPAQALELFRRAYALVPDLTSHENSLSAPAVWLAKAAGIAAAEFEA
ncbi:MAG TPA: glycerate kinase [Verrucomicrobiae bacterium]|nr:glycerate kinase [Verrucomicrobiae bacterium]